MEFAPYRLSGVVYGSLLNHRSAIEALGEAIQQPPYKASPKAPVLYVKPRNTLASDGDVVLIPQDVLEVEVGATLGIVIGRPASRVTAVEAPKFIAGFVLVNDISVPHLPYYRPSVRFKARDGFCPIGARIVAPAELPNPEELVIRVAVDGQLVHQADLRNLVRPINQLISDVTEFMTLSPGDVLTVGVAAPAPRVKAGQAVSIEAEGLGRLQTAFIGEVL